MKHWSKIEVGDLVRCVLLDTLGIGVVVRIIHLPTGHVNAMVYWTGMGTNRTYYADQLELLEEK